MLRGFKEAGKFNVNRILFGSYPEDEVDNKLYS